MKRVSFAQETIRELNCRMLLHEVLWLVISLEISVYTA